MADNTNDTTKSFWQRLFTELLPIEQRSLFGTVVIFATFMLIGWVALNESNRMVTFTAQYEARSIQRGAAIFDGNCASCHGPDGRGLPGIAPALNAQDLFDGSRLESMGWTGSLEDYVELTVSAGRPARSADWPNPMPTWSNEYGGPMRPDEVRDVVNYVMNWNCLYDDSCANETEAAMLRGEEVIQPTPVVVESGPPLGSDIDYVELAASLPPGDPANGELLFNGTLACYTCHSMDGSVLVGPSMPGVQGRMPEGYGSIEEYLAESIWYPDVHKVPGFEDAQMLQDFSARMSEQDLADVIAYLLTLK